MESTVVFTDSSLRESYEKLRVTDPRLAKEIERAMNEITRNHSCGRQVKKQLIPRRLIHKYGINNLWIYNLRKDWRLLYSVDGDHVELLAIILNWMNHKEYERLFKFT